MSIVREEEGHEEGGPRDINVMQPRQAAGFNFLGSPLCTRRPDQTYPHDKNTMGPGGGR
jgi:hypothetical protein